jgi:hypothetical protein
VGGRGRLPLQRLHARNDRSRHEEHPGTAAVGPVIDLPVDALGKVAEVRQPDVDQARPSRAAQQASFEEAREHVRKEGDDIDAHDGSSCGSVIPLPCP